MGEPRLHVLWQPIDLPVHGAIENLDCPAQICMSLPHATEIVQWNALVFKIGGKIFAVLT